jgi:hypothetical protein
MAPARKTSPIAINMMSSMKISFPGWGFLKGEFGLTGIRDREGNESAKIKIP